MKDGTEERGGGNGVKVFLILLPVCLVVSIAGAIWFHWHSETKEEADPALAMGGQGIERAEVKDLLKKFGWLNQEGWESEEGRRGVRQSIALIDGTLSPQNYGFVVQRGAEVSAGGELWPMLWVDVEGNEKKNEVVIVSAGYDGDSGSALSAMTAARVLREAPLKRTVRFLFGPLRIGAEATVRKPGEYLEGSEDGVCFLQLGSFGQADRVVEEGELNVLKMLGEQFSAVDERILAGYGVSRLAGSDLPPRAGFHGERAVSRFQQIEPTGRPGGGHELESRIDEDALIEQTEVLVKVIRELAQEN